MKVPKRTFHLGLCQCPLSYSAISPRTSSSLDIDINIALTHHVIDSIPRVTPSQRHHNIDTAASEMTSSHSNAKGKSPLLDNLQARDQGSLMVPEKYRPRVGGGTHTVNNASKARTQQWDRCPRIVPESAKQVPKRYRPNDGDNSTYISSIAEDEQTHGEYPPSEGFPRSSESVIRRFEECFNKPNANQMSSKEK